VTTAVLEIDGVSAQRRIAPASVAELAEAKHAEPSPYAPEEDDELPLHRQPHQRRPTD